MGVRILEGRYDGIGTRAVLVDSVTEWAFGPLFDDLAEAEAFLEWIEDFAKPGLDTRNLARYELRNYVSKFRRDHGQATKSA